MRDWLKRKQHDHSVSYYLNLYKHTRNVLRTHFRARTLLLGQSWITFAHARVLTGRWFERKWSCVLLALFVVYFWICFSKLNVVVLGKPVISSMKITEKFHGQCFWSLAVARGVVLNDHLKMLAIQWGAVHVCDRSFHLTAYFCKTVYSLSMA